MLKQMKLIYSQGFSKNEKLEWKPVIFSNIIQSFKVIFEAMEELGIDFENPENEVSQISRKPQRLHHAAGCRWSLISFNLRHCSKLTSAEETHGTCPGGARDQPPRETPGGLSRTHKVTLGRCRCSGCSIKGQRICLARQPFLVSIE